jgi:hypothetical protein
LDRLPCGGLNKLKGGSLLSKKGNEENSSPIVKNLQYNRTFFLKIGYILIESSSVTGLLRS